MIKLNETYPNIQFLVCTVPLTGVRRGPEAILKDILGRARVDALENVKRLKFNRYFKRDFDDIIPIFDLASLESTLPDGTIETFRYKGEKYPCLSKAYRSDYGHLNDFGAKTVSYNLLAFLAEEVYMDEISN